LARRPWIAAGVGASRIYLTAMDRRVKERLIGASILVALAVLVVPELLSGPKPTAAPAPTLPAAVPEPTRNVVVDLSTSKPPASSTAEPIVQDTAAASAASSPENAPPVTKNAPASKNPPPVSNGTAPSSGPAKAASAKPASAKPIAARRAAVESAPSSPISPARGSWSVQLGSFASRANADNLTRQVKGQGFAVFVLPGGSGSSVRYRVRVGPLADRESAERIAAKLKTLGHVGSLVSPAA
jgi:DedD protein